MGWRTWLVTDQRFVDGRPDVITYVSEPRKEPMKLSGEPTVHLIASTSGTDADWVMLIDVQPECVAPPVEMSGYEPSLATDILRGRYCTSFEHPEPIKANEPLPYVVGLPMVNHTFEKGNRIMVQVQSTLFPLYDRNPQRYVPNIFLAKPEDTRKRLSGHGMTATTRATSACRWCRYLIPRPNRRISSQTCLSAMVVCSQVRAHVDWPAF